MHLQADQPAYYVPQYLQSAGVQVVPVPVFYPEATEILGQPVYRKVQDVPGEQQQQRRGSLAPAWRTDHMRDAVVLLCCCVHAGPIDILDVFRKPSDLPPHLDDILAAQPAAVWLQSGITNPAFEEALAQAGIKVVSDRCLMVDHRAAAAASRT